MVANGMNEQLNQIDPELNLETLVTNLTPGNLMKLDNKEKVYELLE